MWRRRRESAQPTDTATCYSIIERQFGVGTARRPYLHAEGPLSDQVADAPNPRAQCRVGFDLNRRSSSGERPESAQPRRCRAFRRRSLHHPICRLSASCGESRWFAEVTIYALASRLSARGREGARRLSAPSTLRIWIAISQQRPSENWPPKTPHQGQAHTSP